jgi:tRNA-specific 2-thiouridylase
VGQRRGLPGGSSRPLYVIDIRPERREVVVGTAADLDGLAVSLEEVNWLARPLAVGDQCAVQVRYRSQAVPATVVSQGTGTLDLALHQAARAITPGQSGVLYDGDRVLGGGIIG